MRHPRALIPILALAISPAPSSAGTTPREDVGGRIDALLSRMPLEEKPGQFQQLGGGPRTGHLLDGQRDSIRRGRVTVTEKVNDRGDRARRGRRRSRAGRR
jgi:hypothetical protein